MRVSLYRYSDDELSLRVFNNEHLYLIRHNKTFIRQLRTMFQFTNRQLFILKRDLAADLIETKRNK